MVWKWFSILLIASTLNISAQSNFECQDPPLYIQGSEIYNNGPSLQLQLASELNDPDNLDFDQLNELLESVIEFKLNSDNRYSEEIIDGVRTIVFTPHFLNNEKILLYFHGGGFVEELVVFQFDMIVEIATRSGSKVYIPFYSLAPTAQYPIQINQMQSIYNSLLNRYNNEKIVFIGDSAGGNLVVALAGKLRDEGIALPKQLVLLSAWLDLNLDNTEIPNYEDLDLILSIELLNEYAEAYLGIGNEQLKNTPYVSPILSDDLGDLPETLLLIGTNEILYPDNKLFATQAEQQGMEINFIEAKGAFHTWPVTPSWFVPESLKAINQIASFINCSGNEIVLSEQNLNTLSFNIYPNPINENSTIHINHFDLIHEEFLITITDLFGNKIFHQTLNSASINDLPIYQLIKSKGVYLIQIYSLSNKLNLVKKIVKS